MGNEFMDKETEQTFSDKTTLSKYIIDFYLRYLTFKESIDVITKTKY